MDQSEFSSEESPRTAIGQRLIAARNAKGMTIQRAAQQLKLGEQWLINFEQDRFENASPVFVRGYLKSYAKLLGINAEELLADLPTIESEVSQQNALPLEYQQHRRLPNRIWRLLGYGLSGLIVLLVIGWWHSHWETLHQTNVKNSAPISKQSVDLSSASAGQTIPISLTTDSLNDKVTSKS